MFVSISAHTAVEAIAIILKHRCEITIQEFVQEGNVPINDDESESHKTFNTGLQAVASGTGS